MTITTRASKGSALTWTEMDNNFLSTVDTNNPIFLAPIKGQFTSISGSNPVYIQSNVTNGATNLALTPNSNTGDKSSTVSLYNQLPGSGLGNTLDLTCYYTYSEINVRKASSGSYIPLSIVVGGAERMGISINGTISFNGSSGTSGQVLASQGTNLPPIWITPSAGAQGGGTDQVFFLNDTTVNTDYTITTGKNALTAGPVTIASGVTVTVPTGSVLTIV